MGAMARLADAWGAFSGAFSSACRPRRRISVSQWADAHRVLSAKGSSEAGPWRTARTPFLREIMDALSSVSPVQRVVLMFATQLGKTEAGLNWLGYIMDYVPSPVLVVVPTIEVRKRWVRQRLHPMLQETPALSVLFDSKRSRDAANTEEIKDYPGGLLVLGGANSPASLASMPIRYVLCDEVDRFPWQVGGEGDPLGLIAERQKTFQDRKTLLVSTPTIKGASRIEAEYEESDRRRYYVPCPDCGEMQPLEWGQLGWDKRTTQAWYTCRECGVAIDESSKPAMLAAGEWRAENPGAPTRGYHLNGLYSPLGLGYRWAELAREWLRVQADPVTLKRFINTTLGESWEDRSSQVQPHQLAQRAEAWPLRTIPVGCLLLTAGVDTQDDRLSVQILGWGRREACWVIDWVELPGTPAREDVWASLSELLQRRFVKSDAPSGVPMRVEAVAIDTGGHYTHEVYQYVRSSPLKRVIAIKGKNTPGGPILAGRPSAQDINWRGRVIRHGVKLWLVSVDTAKHSLYARLQADEDKPESERLVHFAADLPEDYYKQLTAEAFDPERNRWVVRKGRRNEALDTWVYAAAAAHHPELRVHAMRERDWDRLAHALGVTPDDHPVESSAVLTTQSDVRNARRRKSRGSVDGDGGGFGKDEWAL